MWLPGGEISATITSPDGTATLLKLMDDGEHDDGAAGDGIYAGLYTLVTQSEEVQPIDEGAPSPPAADDEGAYQVHLLATLDDLRRETQGSFAVPAGADSDNDGFPDDYVATQCLGNVLSDHDLDQLSCADEYFYGTDPNNSDSDFDGESDESEAIRHGTDPLTPGDDMIEAPEFVQTTAQNGSVWLAYDVKADYTRMLAYRATSPDGPWQYIGDLSLSGNDTDATTTNDETYYYCLQAVNGDDHWSAVVCSEAVTPRLDPILPEAAVLINDGAASTDDPNVLLSFVPYDEGHEDSALGLHGGFDDITEVLISNDPAMTGAEWQPFAQDIPWRLDGCGIQTVYVRFRDASDNESGATATASIEVEGCVYLPIIVKP